MTEKHSVYQQLFDDKGHVIRHLNNERNVALPHLPAFLTHAERFRERPVDFFMIALPPGRHPVLASFNHLKDLDWIPICCPT